MLNADSQDADAQTDLDWLATRIAQIPLAQAMALRISTASLLEVRLCAPLAPNSNDKACAFGGSISALLMLSGWGLLSLQMRHAGLDCGIYIQDSRIEFLKPGWAELQAVASALPGQADRLSSLFRQRGRARAEVQTTLYSDGICCARMQARYVALPP